MIPDGELRLYLGEFGVKNAGFAHEWKIVIGSRRFPYPLISISVQRIQTPPLEITEMTTSASSLVKFRSSLVETVPGAGIWMRTELKYG